MKDYEVHVRVKNGPFMRKLRECGYETVGGFCRTNELMNRAAEISKYANLKKVPINTRGEWRPLVVRISDILRCLPEDLFPPQHYQDALRTNFGVFEADLSEVQDFLIGSNDPYLLIEEQDKAKALTDSLEMLTPREKQVIELRFGLEDGREWILDEIAGKFGVSKERIRQVEAKALRKLKHPGRPISEFMFDKEKPPVSSEASGGSDSA